MTRKPSVGHGACRVCGRDVAAYGSQWRAWHHNRPDRKWPQCEGTGQPVLPLDWSPRLLRSLHLLALASELDAEDDPEARALADALRTFAAKRKGAE